MIFSIDEIRDNLATMLGNEEFVTDKTGVKTIEIIGSSFLASEPAIFGEPNEDYIAREIEWYKSMSLNVNDIPGGAPLIWQQVSSSEGLINSNYGFLVWSDANYKQYDYVLEELLKNPHSRRAVMVYTRPSIWLDYNQNGMSDFICTNTVQYMIRNGFLHAVVQMRSNDVIFGYKNDYAWQKYILNKLADDLNVPAGDIVWNAGSLHVYERHFDLVRKWDEETQNSRVITIPLQPEFG